MINCVLVGTDHIKGLYTHIIFSEAGSSDREKEAATYMLFLDLLYECKEQVCEGNYITTNNVMPSVKSTSHRCNSPRCPIVLLWG